MFIELHILQNFAPSNLNRDDTGSPKDCEFGGVRRARISSQSFKRAIRRHELFEALTAVPVGERTKWLSRRLRDALMTAKEIDKNDEEGKQAAMDVAVAFTRYYAGKKGKMDSKNDLKTNVLLYLSQVEVDTLTEFALANWDAVLEDTRSKKPKYEQVKQVVNKEIIPRVKQRTSAPDIALFGRMLADQPDLEIDAAAQVAHAISTHRVRMEMDYYTAVDRLVELGEIADDQSGAGMVGFTGFNSACFYRYARIDYDQLSHNLDNDSETAKRTVQAFLQTALEAIPTGKQNAFAAQNPTDLALAVVRDDGKSWNLANAFENPVNGKGGFIAPSVREMDRYWGKLTRFYDDSSIKAAAVHTLQYEEALDTLKPHHKETLSDWVTTVLDALEV